MEENVRDSQRLSQLLRLRQVGVVWKTGLSLFSIAVLPRVYTTLRRNWLLRVKGPESTNQESIIPTASATVSEEFIRGNDGYFDNDEVKSLLLLVSAWTAQQGAC